MMDIDSQIADAHRQAEENEAQARLIEARICKIPGADRMLPQRRYGAPVDNAAIGRNLTLRGLIGRKDPQLAAYLGIPYGASAAEEQARQDREAACAAAQVQDRADRIIVGEPGVERITVEHFADRRARYECARIAHEAHAA